MSEHNLLLMFLGGAPNSNNIINHWKEINSEFINKNNIYIVIHPISTKYLKLNQMIRVIFEKYQKQTLKVT